MFLASPYKKGSENPYFPSRFRHIETQSGHSKRIRKLHFLSTQTVFSIPFARFKIGHTPQKFPIIPIATFCFIAYLLQSVHLYLMHSTYVIIPYTAEKSKRSCKFLQKTLMKFSLYFYILCTTKRWCIRTTSISVIFLVLFSFNLASVHVNSIKETCRIVADTLISYLKMAVIAE